MDRAGRASRSNGRERVLAFGEFELDLRRRELRSGGAPLEIAPKPLELLCYLVANRDRAVPKREVLARVWGDASAGESALSSALRDLRRTLGDDGQRPKLVRTHRRRGYRFAARAVPAEPRHGPLVNRERELQALRACLESAAAGVPCIALLRGAPGAGKSRLVDELLRDPQASAFALGIGRCRADLALPYHPWAQALAARLGRAPADTAPVRAAQSSAQACDSDPAALFTAVWRALTRAARARPTLLVLEDLHCADAASLELLLRLARKVGEARVERRLPLLVIATARPAPYGEARRLERLARLAELPFVVSFGLERRDETGAQRL